MDEFELRLKQDAERIMVAPSPGLQSRIDASLAGARPVATPQSRQPGQPGVRLWWLSSLTGLASAAAIILFLNWNQRPADTDVLSPAASVDATKDAGLPDDWGVGGILPLRVKSADLTRSLEEEWVNLQSDLDKARQNLERDVKSTF
jgi:hypothetical protein